METTKIISPEYYATVINCASLVLKLSRNEIKERYKDNPLYVAEYIEKGMTQNIIDIFFEDQKVTVSCRFDKKNICNKSFIFLDDFGEMDNYITYLHDKYDYEYIGSCWVLPNSYLSIKRTEDDIYFLSYY